MSANHQPESNDGGKSAAVKKLTKPKQTPVQIPPAIRRNIAAGCHLVVFRCYVVQGVFFSVNGVFCYVIPIAAVLHLHTYSKHNSTLFPFVWLTLSSYKPPEKCSFTNLFYYFQYVMRSAVRKLLCFCMRKHDRNAGKRLLYYRQHISRQHRRRIPLSVLRFLHLHQ